MSNENNDIQRLKNLAGIQNQDDDSTTRNAPLNESVNNEKSSAETSNVNQKNFNEMKSIMESINSVSGGEDFNKLDEEWANSTEYFDGDSRKMDQPTGEIVDTSLRRYLNAKGDHVTVDENGSHNPEKMMETYKNFKRQENLLEHEDYDSYVEPLRDKGFDITVTEKDDGTLVFDVEKDGKSVKVMEPESGTYKCEGEEKEYSSLDAALKSKFDNLEESNSITESSELTALKRNAGILTEEKIENNEEKTDNTVNIDELKRNAGII